MAIQQMALLAYRAPPAGGDSAYLTSGITVSGGTEFGGSVAMWFDGANFYPGPDGSFNWHTGIYATNAYETKLIQMTLTNGGFNALFAAAPDIWYELGATNPLAQQTTNPPFWQLDAVGTANFSGYLVIRNISNPSVELANVTVYLSIGNAA